MKTLILAMSLISSLPAFAARDTVSLDCEGGSRNAGRMTVKAKRVTVADDKSEGTLRDVTASYTSAQETDAKAQVGRSASLESDTKYRPTKYKNHLRFDLNQLVDPKDFSKYYPDGCSTSLMIPNDVVSRNKSRVEAPVVMNCEQSGGTLHLDCKVETVR